MKRRVREMEEEATRIREMHAQVARDMGGAGSNPGLSGNAATADQTMTSASASTAASGSSTGPSQESIDSRSVYVGNVDYGATTDELHAHFQSCGTINRITIVCDKFTGHPKGFGYIEFADEAAVQTALSLNESLFRNRILKVTAKRTNIPGYNYGGRGGAAAGGYVMMPVPMAMMRGGRGMMPGRGGRGYRGGAAGRSRRFSPY
jgi:polyadenylate-binding protein 2